ncbi:hypothetical protein [Streptomyces sp. NBC_00105]|uniref:hypothetical protein n=1 Tax=Streptomyces sp. NBC_00105 TaxID=2903622 RepID=UPI00324EAA8C
MLDAALRVAVGRHGVMRSRRLARDYETRPESSETAVLWSMTMLMGRRLARHRSRNVTRQPASA